MKYMSSGSRAGGQNSLVLLQTRVRCWPSSILQLKPALKLCHLYQKAQGTMG